MFQTTSRNLFVAARPPSIERSRRRLRESWKRPCTVVDFRREVLIGGRRNHNLDVVPAIPCRDVERMMNRTLRVRTEQGMIKYLIIAALVSIVFVLVYARVRPYLKLIQKIIQSLTAVADIATTTTPRQETRTESKLVRCDSCGTWVPADRALKLKSGLSTYCSTECMSKPASKERRIAG